MDYSTIISGGVEILHSLSYKRDACIVVSQMLNQSSFSVQVATTVYVRPLHNIHIS